MRERQKKCHCYNFMNIYYQRTKSFFFFSHRKNIGKKFFLMVLFSQRFFCSAFLIHFGFARQQWRLVYIVGFDVYVCMCASIVKASKSIAFAGATVRLAGYICQAPTLSTSCATATAAILLACYCVALRQPALYPLAQYSEK